MLFHLRKTVKHLWKILQVWPFMYLRCFETGQRGRVLGAGRDEGSLSWSLTISPLTSLLCLAAEFLSKDTPWGGKSDNRSLWLGACRSGSAWLLVSRARVDSSAFPCAGSAAGAGVLRCSELTGLVAFLRWCSRNEAFGVEGLL